MKHTLPSLAVLLLAVAGCAAPASAGPVASAADPPRITSRGVGTVAGTPDVVTVTLGVQTRGPSAQGALEDNSTRAAALVAVPTERGVATADLRTSRLSVYPTYDGTGARITGYGVSNQVTATLRDIAGAGKLIDAAGGAAGDAVRVEQLGFSIDDDSAVRAQARADAVRRAVDQAGQMAEAAGVTLGAIRSITEQPDAALAYPYAADERLEATSAVPLQPGTQELTVTVEVVHDIG